MHCAGEGCGVRSFRPETRIPAVTVRPAAERRDGNLSILHCELVTSLWKKVLKSLISNRISRRQALKLLLIGIVSTFNAYRREGDGAEELVTSLRGPEALEMRGVARAFRRNPSTTPAPGRRGGRSIPPRGREW